jgi:hypothetical protein
MHKRSGTWDFVIIGASTALRARGSALVRRYAHLGRAHLAQGFFSAGGESRPPVRNEHVN